MAVPQTIIFGCGNILLGDDGFGCAVVAALSARFQLPRGVEALDAGTGIREYLFDYLLAPASRPQKLVVIDAVDFKGVPPGELLEIDPSSISSQKVHDFSLHQFPSVNLLQELHLHTGIEVYILAAQVERIPDTVIPGLSPSLTHAVDTACSRVMEMVCRHQVLEVIDNDV